MKHIDRKVFSLAYTGLALCLCACSSSGDLNTSSGEVGDDAEARRLQGLDQINAAEGYAQVLGLQGGAGVRVAVLDDGVDANHIDLGVVASGVFDNEVPRAGPHGTAVAGIIAARRNGIGMHGVAFNADLISLQITPDEDIEVVDPDRLPGAILAAAGLQDPVFESDIINMSIGGDFRDDLELEAMQLAAGQGKIMVFAAGNDADAQPDFPGQDVIDPLVQGLGIVVGSVDEDDNLSDFSAECGIAQDFCMVAPGEEIFSTVPGSFFDDITGPPLSEPFEITGTSFAAPFVSGAAAVVLAAFPGITGEEVVDRLLSTAEDLGDPGTDEVFGRGRLDLDNALSPQGVLALAGADGLDGERQPLNGSGLTLGSAFSLRDSDLNKLKDIVAFDDDNFPFKIDLSQSPRSLERSTGLAGFVETESLARTFTSTPMGNLAFATLEDDLQEDPYRGEFAPSDTELQPEREAPRMRFDSTMNKDVSVFLTFNEPTNSQIGPVQAVAKNGGRFFQSSAYLAPLDQLAGSQTGGGASFALGKSTQVSVSSFTSAQEDEGVESTLQKAEISHRLLGQIDLKLGYGWLQEEEGFLGSLSTGVFGSNASSETSFMQFALIAPATDKLSFFATYTEAKSSISTGSSSLLSDWQTARSDAFGVGLIWKDIASQGDGLSLMVGQPLRAKSAKATLTTASGRTEEGDVLLERSKIDLGAEGREIATEAVYSLSLGGTQRLETGTFLRLNPDHDPEAKPDVGFGARYRVSF